MSTTKVSYGFDPTLQANIDAGSAEDVEKRLVRMMKTPQGSFFVIKIGNRIPPKDDRLPKWKPEQHNLWILRRFQSGKENSAAMKQFKADVVVALAQKDRKKLTELEKSVPYLYVMVNTKDEVELYNLQTHGKDLFPISPEEKKKIIENPMLVASVEIRSKNDAVTNTSGVSLKYYAPVICPRMLLYMLKQSLGNNSAMAFPNHQPITKPPQPAPPAVPSSPVKPVVSVSVAQAPTFDNPLNFDSPVESEPSAAAPPDATESATKESTPPSKPAEEPAKMKKKATVITKPTDPVKKKTTMTTTTISTNPSLEKKTKASVAAAKSAEQAKKTKSVTTKTVSADAGKKTTTKPVETKEKVSKEKEKEKEKTPKEAPAKTKRSAKVQAAKNITEADKELLEDNEEDDEDFDNPTEELMEEDTQNVLEYQEDDENEPEGTARKFEQERLAEPGEETDDDEKQHEDEGFIDKTASALPETGNDLSVLDKSTMHPDVVAFLKKDPKTCAQFSDPVEMDRKSVNDFCSTTKRRKLLVVPFDPELLFGEGMLIVNEPPVKKARAKSPEEGGKTTANGTASSKKKSSGTKRKRSEPDDADDADDTENKSVVRQLMDVAISRMNVEDKDKKSRSELIQIRRDKYGPHMLAQFGNNPADPKLDKASPEVKKELLHLIKFCFWFMPELDRAVRKEALRRHKVRKAEKLAKKREAKKAKKTETREEIENIWD